VKKEIFRETLNKYTYAN